MISPRIITRSGRLVDPFDMQPGDIDISDIAHALSNLCRFGGHLKKFYSVAQHSVHVAERVAERGESKRFVLAALLHDASEAYLGDIVRPIKAQRSFSSYRQTETDLQQLIDEHFDCANFEDSPPWFIIDDADRDLMLLEAIQLGGWDVRSWEGYREPSFHRLMISLRPERAKIFFLEYFEYLQQEIALEAYTPETERES